MLSGHVEDAATGERLAGATLYDSQRRTGTTTNAYGFFSLPLPAGTVRLTVSYVGYRDTTLIIALSASAWSTIQLQAKAVDLDEVEVVANKIATAGVSQIEISPQRIRELPVLLGEADALKALQLMPGVQGGTEGSAGLYVRGGSPDQNLILLDGAPVYNASHLFGFFSVFNTDALQNVRLIKGGFPARYGGRLSSVVDVAMREGNLRELSGQGNVGLVASRFTVEGPIIKDKSSFILSGRRTYLDLITRPIYRFFIPGAAVGYYFYDLNAKVNYIVSPRTRAFASVYGGDDRFYSRVTEAFEGSGDTEAKEVGAGWGNLTATVRLTHVASPKLFGALTLLHSRYRFGTSIEERNERTREGGRRMEESRIRYESGLRDWGGKADVEYALTPSHAISAGLSLTHHTFRPDVIEQHTFESGEAPLDTIYDAPISATEWAAYGEDQLRLGRALTANLGVHASGFHEGGRWYGSLQPRLSAGYRPTERWQLRASFTTMRQYIHLLSNSGIELPTDLWVPATRAVQPERALQVGLGVGRSSSDGLYELSLETFYKAVSGVLTYKEGASFIETGSSWEEKVTSGNGRSYGAELFVRKERGETTGWLAYTLGWAWRRFDEIDGGKPFPYRYDRRHNVSLVVNHRLSERRSLSATWVYQTGTAVTLPVGRYVFGPSTVPSIFHGDVYEHYEGRNGVRMRPYHRLDFAYHVRYPAQWGEGELSLGLYNAYSRMNPFYMELEEQGEFDPDTGAYRPRYVYKEVGLVPVVPFISYGFTF